VEEKYQKEIAKLQEKYQTEICKVEEKCRKVTAELEVLFLCETGSKLIFLLGQKLGKKCKFCQEAGNGQFEGTTEGQNQLESS
jgi:ABC-type hemin transport system substrate-binding protein